MSTRRDGKSPLWAFIEGNLTARGLNTGDLSRATGVHRSRFSNWRKGKSPTIDTARALATFFDVPLLEVLVTAQLITHAEAGMTEWRTPSSLSDQELLAELGSRLDNGAQTVTLEADRA